MSYLVACCPYCRGCRVTLSDGPRGWEFGLRYTGAVACSHLVFASVGVHVVSEAGGRVVGRRCGSWFWAFGTGLRVLARKGAPDPVTAYVTELCCGLTGAGERPRWPEYVVAGATAGEREARRPGSGEFPVSGRAGEDLWAVLDGWAVFSPGPAALAAEVDRQSRGTRPGSAGSLAPGAGP